MKIIDVVCSGGRTGFYFDDQRAIKAGAANYVNNLHDRVLSLILNM